MEKTDTMPPGGLANNRHGRVEIADPAIFERLNLRLTDAVVQQIRQLEESIQTAEQRLGTFRVG
ncbi:hypothetical protein [Sphingomonas sp. RB1R13]|uniref:hypothetical protein n=1 Tax=Sphingomonas sp. RB1R13 TaxID=3096159 RepID=UPI002FC690A3